MFMRSCGATWSHRSRHRYHLLYYLPPKASGTSFHRRLRYSRLPTAVRLHYVLEVIHPMAAGLHCHFSTFNRDAIGLGFTIHPPSTVCWTRRTWL